ncbi:MAG: BNR repeat-containing protein [Verrucomicrobiae bacterium]|nr:BNR repeat-containing protein [Verrucomicrobiae bacterium]
MRVAWCASVSLAFAALFCPALGAELGLRRADGYRGIWFTLGQFTKHGDKYSGGLGTYTANHNPLAVYAPKVNKTFFTYGGTTAKDKRHLLIMVSYYDHNTGTVPRPVIVHDKQGVDDPHDNASINIDPDGHIWIFVSGRGRIRPGFKYRSLQPYSIAGFERIYEGEMTYPQPWPLHGAGWLHLFTKYTKGRELYWETSADGRTWSQHQKLAGFGGHYQVSEARAGKVGTFFNYHPGGSPDKRTNLYYVQSEDAGRTWTTVERRLLETPLSAVRNPALVVDYEAQALLMYTCDLSFDTDGNPLLLYVTSRGYAPGPENEPREFRLTRWTGKNWETTVVCRTDHNYDMGSLWVLQDEWKVIAPTLPGPQPYGAGGEMCLWSSRDHGRSWSLKRQITHNSPRNHNYARRPRSARDPFFAFWADGNPREFSESCLYFCDSSGENVWQLPYDMAGETVSPKRLTGR